ncbi:MAG: acetyltransferase [Lachnospiraceae bacterium]|nr:acetyltransferase [Lachnospiraceae bacterium]
MKQILILGGGGHAASLADILERENKYKIAGFVVNEHMASCNIKYPVIGTDDDLLNLFQRGIKNAVIGVGYLGKSNLREKLYERLKRIGFDLPFICDPSAIVSEHVEIGEGTSIGKGAIINAGADIGKMCIINTGAIIEHDCIVEDFSHISVGSVLCGSVRVGEASFVGANATVIHGTKIGNHCIIGAGAAVRKNVEDNCMVGSKENIVIKRGYNLP